ncbi:MAG: hypothetical protein JRD04_00895 [Deltaproteobacteria bacterium]|nr:hypothetical protein [Deltaproteobacteria bacterium]
MKRYLLALTLFVSSLLLLSCVSTGPSKTGALVKVYRPNVEAASLACSTPQSKGISFMYVGPETVSGQAGAKDKKLITQFARSVLSETRVINPIGIPPMEGEYPNLSIDVLELSVTDRKKQNRITRKGVFEANINIRQMGLIDCKTAEPILIEKQYEVPSYKPETLPSPRKLKGKMIKEAVRQAVRQFVPVKRTVLRPVKTGGGDLVEKSARMIDGGNCRGAYEAIKPVVKNPGCQEANLLYNAGVAVECMAWNGGHNQQTQARYLQEAQKYYRKAAMLTPEDGDMQKAAREVSYEVETFFVSSGTQNDTRQERDKYKAPTGY